MKRASRFCLRLAAPAAAIVLLVAGMCATTPAAIAAPASDSGQAPFTPGPAVTRRLTAEQFQNIIHDVFGDDIDLGGRFEPDLRSDGLIAVGASRVSIGPSSMEQYDAMGRAVASQVTNAAHRGNLIPCKPAAEDAFDERCASAFLGKVGRLIYRRPLTSTQLNAYVTAAKGAAQSTHSFHEGLSLSLAAMLSSPAFLFREEILERDSGHPGTARLDAYSRASQLSFFLWNSAPDLKLLDAAARGDLQTPKGLAREVDRMLASPRLEAGVRAFFVDDLRFDEFEVLAKDAALFPKFSAQVAGDAREQTLRTIVDVVLTRDADFREIFTTKKTFMTPELASVYRVPVFADGPNGAPDGWQPYTFAESDPRAGIVTQIAFTALHSPAGRSSPTIRGKALREVLLCQRVPAPPGNVDFTLFESAGAKHDSTARQRLGAHATNPVCAGCHKIMDPIGLALEHFDGAGEFRPTDNGASIDASGVLDGIDYTDSNGLARAIASNPAATSCMVDRMSGRALGRMPAAGEKTWIKGLNDSFASDGYRLRALMRAIAVSDALYRVSEDQPNKPSLTTSLRAPQAAAADPELSP